MVLLLYFGDQSAPHSLEPGPLTAGGSAEDALRVPGLAPGVARFEEDGGRLFVTFIRPMAIDGVLVPSNVRRLVLPGEKVELGEGAHVELPAATAQTPGTATVLRGLMQDPETCPAGSPRLTCLNGLDAGRVFPLADEELEIGRASEVDIRIRDRAVSRRHARVRRLEGRWWVEDRGTPNGTFVNNARTAGPVGLQPGTIIEVGGALLRFDAPELTEPDVELPTVEEPQAPGGKPRRSMELLLLASGAAVILLGSGITWAVLSSAAAR